MIKKIRNKIIEEFKRNFGDKTIYIKNYEIFSESINKQQIYALYYRTIKGTLHNENYLYLNAYTGSQHSKLTVSAENLLMFCEDYLVKDITEY